MEIIINCKNQAQIKTLVEFFEDPLSLQVIEQSGKNNANFDTVEVEYQTERVIINID
jgi:hypothetical protein